MGRMRRRQRRTVDGNGGNGHGPDTGGPARLEMQTLAPTYVPMRDGRPPVVAPVLELEGLEPWAEITGPALVVEECADGSADCCCDDPTQLELAPENAEPLEAETVTAAEDDRPADAREPVTTTVAEPLPPSPRARRRFRLLRPRRPPIRSRRCTPKHARPPTPARPAARRRCTGSC